MWRTVDLQRGRTLLAAACDEAEQPGQAEGMVAVRVRHEDLVHHRRAHHAALQLDLRPLTRVEEPEGVFHLYVGNKPAQASASWLSGGDLQRQIVLQAAPSFGQPRPISCLGRAGRPYGPCFPQGSARAAQGRTRCGRATGCTRRCPGSSSRRPRRCCRARSFGPPAGRSKRRPAAAVTMGNWVPAQSASLAAPPQVLRRPLDAERSDQRGPRPLPPGAWRE